MTIYANLMGRLGNQMFIYAFARTLQLMRGNVEDLVLTSADDNRLDNLHVAPFLKKQEYGVWEKGDRTLRQWFLGMYYGKYAIGKTPRKLFDFEAKYRGLFEQNGLCFCRNGFLPFSPPSKVKSIFCKGFFQSEKYFSVCADVLHREFQPRIIRPEVAKLGNTLRESDVVCVSIRLGDYLKHPIHGVCSLGYYARAMRLFKERLGSHISFYISSETPEIVSEMREFEDFEMMLETKQLLDYEKLWLTSQCTHFILSNSSFAWWGYWLSEARQKKNSLVIAPDRWYNTDIPCDIYLPEMKLLPPDE